MSHFRWEIDLLLIWSQRLKHGEVVCRWKRRKRVVASLNAWLVEALPRHSLLMGSSPEWMSTLPLISERGWGETGSSPVAWEDIRPKIVLSVERREWSVLLPSNVDRIDNIETSWYVTAGFMRPNTIVLSLSKRLTLNLRLFCLLSYWHSFFHHLKVLLESIGLVFNCLRNLFFHLFELVLSGLTASSTPTGRGPSHFRRRSWSWPALRHLIESLCYSPSFSFRLIWFFSGATFWSLGGLFPHIIHKAGFLRRRDLNHARLI